jgi:peptidoglycan/xylan/chitin deacetylase (PgdA/CDA1 family)
MGFIRNTYHRLLLVPGVPSLFRNARRNCATIFMMHRFTHRDRGIHGFDPGQLRKGLEYLHRNKYEFLSLTDLFSRLAGNGPELRGGVVFTIDDGYIDHAEIAAPIFAEFDCPVTTFVTTGFLDGQLWMWWNKVEYIFASSRRRPLEFGLDNDAIRYDLINDEAIGAAQEDFVQRCKAVGADERLKAIAILAENAEVDLPVSPPVIYAPMTWDNARACERIGMTFGPHTVTHPILSQLPTEQQATWEISESWRRLCAEVVNPVPVFCYPNGQWPDFGPREMAIFRNIGLTGAVAGEPGFADMASFSQDKDGPFKVCRLPFPETLSDLIQYVSGIERCKQLVRSLK